MVEQNGALMAEARRVPPYQVPEALAIQEAALSTLGLLAPNGEHPGIEAPKPQTMSSTQQPLDVGRGAPGCDAAEETSGPAVIADALTDAHADVLEHTRQLLATCRQQQDALATANRAEEAWLIARYSSSSTKEEVNAANRTRLAARKAYQKAREEYLAMAQRLCRATERMVELEAFAGATATGRCRGDR